jgi:hypothetical protein
MVYTVSINGAADVVVTGCALGGRNDSNVK